jgi:anti-sigma regulatory factor (Ser/Thr protein kinase)
MTWLIPIDDEASVALARVRLRDLGAQIGATAEVVERAAVIASELGHNQLRHARLGELMVRGLRRGPTVGVEIVATDAGEGFGDPVESFRGAMRFDGTGLGVGLAGVRRLSTEVDVASRQREGVRIVARVLPPGAPSHPSLAIVGRPHPAEPRSGDDFAVVRDDERVVIILADGLGHGPDARAAAELACRCCARHAALSPSEALQACDAPLRDTRGSAVGVASLDLRSDEVTVAIAGNVRFGLYGPDSAHRFPYTPRVLGRSQSGRIQSTTLPRAGRTLIGFTDGLPERADPTLDRAGLAGWPLPLATRLLSRFGSDRDDATVIALR